MPVDIFIALTVFACVMAFTPGPNNIMLAASGVNFGFSRTVPHIVGVTLGFLILLAACGAGLGVAFEAVPDAQLALKVAGAVYMLWLAFKIATAQPANAGQGAPPRPFTFLQAVAFQWVNPKAVVACLSAIAVYVRPDHVRTDFPVMFGVLGMATALSTMTWAGFGVGFRRFLREPMHARVFNAVMALLLVASIVPMVS